MAKAKRNPKPQPKPVATVLEPSVAPPEQDVYRCSHVQLIDRPSHYEEGKGFTKHELAIGVVLHPDSKQRFFRPSEKEGIATSKIVDVKLNEVDGSIVFTTKSGSKYAISAEDTRSECGFFSERDHIRDGKKNSESYDRVLREKNAEIREAIQVATDFKRRIEFMSAKIVRLERELAEKNAKLANILMNKSELLF